jgi:hypothetical protein
MNKRSIRQQMSLGGFSLPFYFSEYAKQSRSAETKMKK